MHVIDLFWLITLLTAKADGNYWAYLPNPPLLHPVTWEDKLVPIYVNDTKILGLPSNEHIWYQRQEHYNYSGLSMHLPICFTTNASVSSCVYLQHTSEGDGNELAPGSHWDVDLLYPKMNCSTKGPGIPPQRVKACSGCVSSSNYGIEWMTCHSNETAIILPVTGLNIPMAANLQDRRRDYGLATTKHGRMNCGN